MEHTMGQTTKQSGSVWSRLAIIAILLILLIGPNFGPVPLLLNRSLSVRMSLIGVLISFIIGFSIILAVVMRMSGERSLGALLRSLGLGVPAPWYVNLVGAIVGLLWGALLLTSIFQFDPNANIAEISGFRVIVAIMAAFGALLEDLITRSFVMNQLKSIRVPGWLQLVLSAVLFAVYHTIWAGFNVFSFAFSIVYGVLLAGLFLWGKRSLTPVILGHSLAVLISEPFATMIIFLSAQ